MSPDIDPRLADDTNSSGKTSEDAAAEKSQQLSALQHAQSAALLSFKPSSRDVISGIAPHVLDELHERAPYRARRRSRSRSRGSSPDRGHRRASSVPRHSPLRVSVAFVDDLNAGIVQPENVVLKLYPSVPATSAPMSASLARNNTDAEHNNATKLSKRRTGSGGSNSSRIDRVLKSVTLVFRLK